MRNKLGKKAFTPYLEQKILEFSNKLDHLHSADIISFKDKEGNELKSTFAKVTNLKDFIKEISDVRGIKNPQIILGTGVYGEELSRSHDLFLQGAQSFKNWGRTWG